MFSVYRFPLWWLGEYSLCFIIIIKSEVWTIIHGLGLGNKTMVCAVCLSLFLLVQIMACGLVGAKPLSAPKMWYYQLEPSNKFQWNFKRNSYVFIQENAFENVIWEMATTLSRLQWVKRPRVHWRCLGLARWGLSVVENIVLCVF